MLRQRKERLPEGSYTHRGKVIGCSEYFPAKKDYSVYVNVYKDLFTLIFFLAIFPRLHHQ